MHFPHADTSSHVNKFTYTHNRAHTDSKFSQHKAPQCVDWDSRLTRTKSSTVKELLQWRLWALRNREAGLTGIYGENISQFPKKKRLTSKSPPSDTNTASKQSNTGLNGCTKAWACGNNSDATPGFANSKLKWEINTHIAHYASFSALILYYFILTSLFIKTVVVKNVQWTSLSSHHVGERAGVSEALIKGSPLT